MLNPVTFSVSFTFSFSFSLKNNDRYRHSCLSKRAHMQRIRVVMPVTGSNRGNLGLSDGAQPRINIVDNALLLLGTLLLLIVPVLLLLLLGTQRVPDCSLLSS